MAGLTGLFGEDLLVLRGFACLVGIGVTLVSGDGTALAFKSGSRPDMTEVSLPAAGSIQMTSTDAWVLKIVK